MSLNFIRLNPVHFLTSRCPKLFHYYPPIHAYNSYCLLPWRLLTRSSIHSSSPPTSDTRRATCKKIYKIAHISCPVYPFIYYPYHTTYIINTAYFMYNPLLPGNEVFRSFPSCHLYSYRDKFHFIVAYLVRSSASFFPTFLWFQLQLRCQGDLRSFGILLSIIMVDP